VKGDRTSSLFPFSGGCVHKAIASVFSPEKSGLRPFFSFSVVGPGPPPRVGGEGLFFFPATRLTTFLLLPPEQRFQFGNFPFLSPRR